MTIPIPIGERRICTVTASAPRIIRCEQCGRSYAYWVARQGEGIAQNVLWLRGEEASREAQLKAAAQAQAALADAVDPVPCPNCGWLQSTMIGRARQLYLHHLNRAGLLLPMFGLVLLLFFVPAHRAFPESLPLSIGFRLDQCAIIGGPLLVVLRFLLARRYQPNAQPLEKRLESGRARAVLVDDPAVREQQSR